MSMMEDDNDKVLITKERLAELEYDSRLLKELLRYENDKRDLLVIVDECKQTLVIEDVCNGEYDKKD